MQRVIGTGCCPFRATEPEKLREWYRKNLGIDLAPDDCGQPASPQNASLAAFTPFSPDIAYFGAAAELWIIHFWGRDLDALADQLRSAGIEVSIDPEMYSNGRIARLHDPDGNPIELWESREDF